MASDSLQIALMQEVRAFLEDSFMSKAKQRSDIESQLALTVFNNELREQQLNRNWFRENQIALPEELRTAGSEYFIENSGDSNTAERLGSVVGQMQNNNKVLNDAIANFYIGQQKAEDLFLQGKTKSKADDSYYDKVTFSDPEIGELVKSGDLNQDIFVDDYVLQGFKSFNDPESAMRRVKYSIDIEAAEMAMNEKHYEYSKKKHADTVVGIGTDIVNAISSNTNIQLGGMENALEDKDEGFEFFQQYGIDEIIKQKEKYPDIYNDLLYAVGKLAERKSTAYDNMQGFVSMASDAHKLQQIMQIIEIQELQKGNIQSSGKWMEDEDREWLVHNNVKFDIPGAGGKFAGLAYDQVFNRVIQYTKLFGPDIMNSGTVLETASRAMKVKQNLDKGMDLSSDPNYTGEGESIIDPTDLNILRDILGGGGKDDTKGEPNTLDINVQEGWGSSTNQTHSTTELLSSYKDDMERLRELESWLENNPQDNSTMASSKRSMEQYEEYRLTTEEATELRAKWYENRKVVNLGSVDKSQWKSVGIYFEDLISRGVGSEDLITDPEVIENKEALNALNLLLPTGNQNFDLGTDILSTVYGFTPANINRLLQIDGIDDESLPNLLAMLSEDITTFEGKSPTQIIDIIAAGFAKIAE